jgi:hypothetical protein
MDSSLIQADASNNSIIDLNSLKSQDKWLNLQETYLTVIINKGYLRGAGCSAPESPRSFGSGQMQFKRMYLGNSPFSLRCTMPGFLFWSGF